MISFTLVCEKGHEFDGWFQNSAAFEEQVKKRIVTCPSCGSAKVEKGLMAPAIPAKSNRKDADKAPVHGGAPDPKTRELIEQVRKLRDHIAENSEYVGDRFPEEARKIHYEETEARGIYGEASLEEARELLEEGVEVLPVPNIPEDHN